MFVILLARLTRHSANLLERPSLMVSEAGVPLWDHFASAFASMILLSPHLSGFSMP